jgi:hypothetical protein
MPKELSQNGARYSATAELTARPKTAPQQPAHLGTEHEPHASVREPAALLTSEDGGCLRISDEHGRVLQDYQDFLRNNTLPR